MRPWVVVLMVVLAALDATPLWALTSAPVAHAAMTCRCRGECRCRSCPIHHPNAVRSCSMAPRRIALPTGACVMNCSGCRESSPAAAPPITTPYEVPAIHEPAGTMLAERPPGTIVPEPAAAPSPSLDPPPRPIAS